MKIKYFILAASCLLLPLVWARLAGVSRSPRKALERASANSIYSNEYINNKIVSHLSAKGLSPRSCGVLYTSGEDNGVTEIHSTGEELVLRDLEKMDLRFLDYVVLDSPVYFKLHSKFGFYWVSIEP